MPIRPRALDQLQIALSKMPDVIAASVADGMPPRLSLEGAQLETSDRGQITSDSALGFATVDDDFFRTPGIPLLQGRVFDESDHAGSARAVVISRSLAQRVWPGVSAIGRQFREDTHSPWLAVVGIVGDVMSGGLDQPLGPLAMYTSRSQATDVWPFTSVIIRTRSAPETVVSAVRRTIRRILPDAPIIGVETAYDSIADSNARVRLTMFAAALAASYVPAWRAGRSDPVEALHRE